MSVSAHAAATRVMDSEGCDPEFWGVLEGRASIEAERENEAAWRLILKPDSVLQYSCFAQHVTALGVAADVMFSDRETAPLYTSHALVAPRLPPATPIPLGPNGPDPLVPLPPNYQDALDDMLEDIVVEPMEEYLDTNFGHNYAGGLHPTGGVCAHMAAVWQFVKCEDFNQDLFVNDFDFPSTDIRAIPSVASGRVPYGGGCSNHATKISDLFLIANPPPASPPVAGGIETPPTADLWYNPRMHRTGGSCAAAFPIPTGITVSHGGGNYADAVCSVPGCYYTRGGCAP